MRIFLTGGAGFIGSHVLLNLLSRREDFEILVVDNLYNSSSTVIKNISDFTSKSFDFEQIDVRNEKKLSEIVKAFKPNLTFHFAGLKSVYESEKDDTTKLELKTLLISQLVEDYKEHVRQWTEGNEFSYWMRGEINNAKLETIADYNQWVPAMQTFLRSRGLKKFSLEMMRLAGLPFSDRQVILASMPITVAVDNK